MKIICCLVDSGARSMEEVIQKIKEYVQLNEKCFWKRVY